MCGINKAGQLDATGALSPDAIKSFLGQELATIQEKAEQRWMPVLRARSMFSGKDTPTDKISHMAELLERMGNLNEQQLKCLEEVLSHLERGFYLQIHPAK